MLFSTKTYTLQPTTNQGAELNKSFCNNSLSDYHNKNAIYLTYIDKHHGIHVLKYDKLKILSQEVSMIIVRHSKHLMLYAYGKLTCEMLTSMTKKKNLELFQNLLKTVKELIKINKVHNLQFCIDKIDKVINGTILPKDDVIETKNILIEAKDRIIKLLTIKNKKKY